MARMILTEQEKKKRRKKKLLFILIILIALGIGGFFTYKYFYNKAHPKAVVVTVVDQVDEFEYTLSDLDSEYYKTEFKKLKEIVTADTIDEEAYATQLAKCFAIDLYTISTKINKYDIGGQEYFYSDKKDDFGKEVLSTIYDTVADNTYGDRKQNLPEVKEAIVQSTEATKYLMGEELVDGYLVKIALTYKDVKADEGVSIVVVKEKSGKKVGVVDVQNTLEPKYETAPKQTQKKK